MGGKKGLRKKTNRATRIGVTSKITIILIICLIKKGFYLILIYNI